MRGTDPPLCAAHAGRTGAPLGNQNARVHGWYARPARPIEGIDDVIDLVGQKLAEMNEHMATVDDPEVLAKLGGLLLQGASRYGRLLRDKRALSGESADGLLEAIGQALDELSTELGIEL